LVVLKQPTKVVFFEHVATQPVQNSSTQVSPKADLIAKELFFIEHRIPPEGDLAVVEALEENTNESDLASRTVFLAVAGPTVDPICLPLPPNESNEAKKEQPIQGRFACTRPQHMLMGGRVKVKIVIENGKVRR